MTIRSSESLETRNWICESKPIPGFIIWCQQHEFFADTLSDFYFSCSA